LGFPSRRRKESHDFSFESAASALLMDAPAMWPWVLG